MMTDKFNPRDMAQLDNIYKNALSIKNCADCDISDLHFAHLVSCYVPALIEEVKRLNAVVETQGEGIRNAVALAQENGRLRSLINDMKKMAYDEAVMQGPDGDQHGHLDHILMLARLANASGKAEGV